MIPTSPRGPGSCCWESRLPSARPLSVSSRAASRPIGRTRSFVVWTKDYHDGGLVGARSTRPPALSTPHTRCIRDCNLGVFATTWHGAAPSPISSVARRTASGVCDVWRRCASGNIVRVAARATTLRTIQWPNGPTPKPHSPTQDQVGEVRGQGPRCPLLDLDLFLSLTGILLFGVGC